MHLIYAYLNFKVYMGRYDSLSKPSGHPIQRQACAAWLRSTEVGSAVA